MRKAPVRTAVTVAAPQEREKRIRAAAEEVIAEWGKYRKSLPKFALDAIFDVTELKWPDLAFATILGGGTTWGIGAPSWIRDHLGLLCWSEDLEKIQTGRVISLRLFEQSCQSSVQKPVIPLLSAFYIKTAFFDVAEDAHSVSCKNYRSSSLKRLAVLGAEYEADV